MKKGRRRGIALCCGLTILMGLWAGGCGYGLSSSPYGLNEPLALRIPLAENQTRIDTLGAFLTRSMIRRLDGVPGITVSESAPNSLNMEIKSFMISGGAWQTDDDSDAPERSASRMVALSVEAILVKKDDQGQSTLSRRLLSSRRTFLVGGDYGQTESRQNEAMTWVVDDICQKIGQSLFSEF